jgi:hypothetical protein
VTTNERKYPLQFDENTVAERKNAPMENRRFEPSQLPNTSKNAMQSSVHPSHYFLGRSSSTADASEAASVPGRLVERKRMRPLGPSGFGDVASVVFC